MKRWSAVRVSPVTLANSGLSNSQLSGPHAHGRSRPSLRWVRLEIPEGFFGGVFSFEGRAKVGRVTPCAPGFDFAAGGAHGVTRPTFALPSKEKTPPKNPSGISSLTQRKLGRLRPWAWGPDSWELLKPLFANVTGETRTADQRFNTSLAQLYSKAWSADFLRTLLIGRRRGNESLNSPSEIHQSLLTSSPTEDWLCTAAEVGVAATSMDQAIAAIQKIRQRGQHKIVVKEALGLAGSNAVRLFEPEVLPTHQRWMERALSNGRQLVVEPWLERVLDFSIQLEMSADGLKLCGYTGLLNDAKGQFQGNFAESHHHKRIPTKVVTLFREPDISNRLLELYAGIFTALEAELRRVDFTGPLGIDAFVYRDAAGGARLKPVVEINPRYTMGRVLVELMKQTCQGSCGKFRLVNHAQSRKEGFENFPAFARTLNERFPLVLEGEPFPRIRTGAVCLNDPATAQVCLAVFHVGRTLAELETDVAC